MRHVCGTLVVLAVAASLPITAAARNARPTETTPPVTAAPTSAAPSVTTDAARPASSAEARAAPSTPDIRHWASSCRTRTIAHPLYLVLDGESAPTARREAALTALERCAQSGMVGSEDVMGSLYWMGRELPDALVAHDASQAETYFSNAAVHGAILDMYRMAWIELEQDHIDAAMIWALLYAHYEPLIARPAGKSHRVLAELMVQIDRRFDKKKLPGAIAHANAIIVQYDAAIRGYLAFIKSHSPRRGKWGPAKRNITLPYLQLANPAPGPPYAGIAEFLIAYRPDGRASKAWLLSAMPDSIAQRLQDAVLIPRAPPVSRSGLRYLVRTVKYDQPRIGVKLRN